tara:strand:- start:173 stop:343 length:171 start_codon:yes stop_codon:yes gene_type:complete
MNAIEDSIKKKINLIALSVALLALELLLKSLGPILYLSFSRKDLSVIFVCLIVYLL